MVARSTLASVTEQQVQEFRAGLRSRLEPSATFRVSERVVEHMEVEPVRGVLARALHGGSALESGRPDSTQMRVHEVRDTHLLSAELHRVRAHLRKDAAFQMHRLQDSWAGEVDTFTRAFEFAAGHGECMVSILRPSLDSSTLSIELPVLRR